ncbi:MAG: radical SAM protein [Lachnospiraceae bacterium]|nr:radical SAM protein [Lachnospiraceae bacterium]MBR4767506.1 radical SAM protein [Lachnospiraceae bacterium]
MNLSDCTICPRNCHADRAAGRAGYCGVPGETVFLGRAALHYYEEPCISGKEGSGAVFFSGCSLRCVYCQNAELSTFRVGKEITVERLSEIFLELQKQGANTLNLVTPTHYACQILKALKTAKLCGLSIPVVYNTGGYEKAETLKELEGLIDVYLTDFKYMDPVLARHLSGAADYPETAKSALAEMVRQCPDPCFSPTGIMTHGILIRHLLLPGHVKNAIDTVDYIYRLYGEHVYFSLMNQYTVLGDFPEAPELNRKVTRREYGRFIDHALEIGIRNAFIQEGGTEKASFIPEWDFEGV